MRQDIEINIMNILTGGRDKAWYTDPEEVIGVPGHYYYRPKSIKHPHTLEVAIKHNLVIEYGAVALKLSTEVTCLYTQQNVLRTDKLEALEFDEIPETEGVAEFDEQTIAAEFYKLPQDMGIIRLTYFRGEQY